MLTALILLLSGAALLARQATLSPRPVPVRVRTDRARADQVRANWDRR